MERGMRVVPRSPGCACGDPHPRVRLRRPPSRGAPAATSIAGCACGDLHRGVRLRQPWALLWNAFGVGRTTTPQGSHIRAQGRRRRTLGDRRHHTPPRSTLKGSHNGARGRRRRTPRRGGGSRANRRIMNVPFAPVEPRGGSTVRRDQRPPVSNPRASHHVTERTATSSVPLPYVASRVTSRRRRTRRVAGSNSR